jgi:hypothetical protein
MRTAKEKAAGKMTAHRSRSVAKRPEREEYLEGRTFIFSRTLASKVIKSFEHAVIHIVRCAGIHFNTFAAMSI